MQNSMTGMLGDRLICGGILHERVIARKGTSFGMRNAIAARRLAILQRCVNWAAGRYEIQIILTHHLRKKR